MNGTDPCPQCGQEMRTHGGYPAQTRCTFRDESDLTPQLVGLEGWRVEVRDVRERDDTEDDTEDNPHTRRFYVGRSTGWKPIHLEIHNRRSHSGGPARKSYASVRRLYKR